MRLKSTVVAVFAAAAMFAGAAHAQDKPNELKIGITRSCRVRRPCSACPARPPPR